MFSGIMALDKDSDQSDAIVNLYRAALYLARGSRETGLQFLVKARKRLGKSLLPRLPADELKSRQQQLFWAEKILDQYKKLKSL